MTPLVIIIKKPHEYQGNDRQLKKLLIVTQILHIRTQEMNREHYGEYAY